MCVAAMPISNNAPNPVAALGKSKATYPPRLSARNNRLRCHFSGHVLPRRPTIRAYPAASDSNSDSETRWAAWIADAVGAGKPCQSRFFATGPVRVAPGSRVGHVNDDSDGEG